MTPTPTKPGIVQNFRERMWPREPRWVTEFRADIKAIKSRQIEIINLLGLQGEKTLAGITDIQTAQTAEKADLVTLTGTIAQLLAAFASGAMTPAQAQAVLDEINSEDATVKSNIASIQGALPAAV